VRRHSSREGIWQGRDDRSELEVVMSFVRPGDTLVVVKLGRLGRSTRDVLNLVHELEQRGAALRVLEPAIDTGGPMGKTVLTVLGMVAEMELSFIKSTHEPAAFHIAPQTTSTCAGAGAPRRHVPTETD
jgi:DNA invertase Pin-like site-specific DNA recombinase